MAMPAVIMPIPLSGLVICSSKVVEQLKNTAILENEYSINTVLSRPPF